MGSVAGVVAAAAGVVFGVIPLVQTRRKARLQPAAKTLPAVTLGGQGIQAGTGNKQVNQFIETYIERQLPTAAPAQDVDVDRPDRAGRRRNGKSDSLDAGSAARAVQSGRATGTPKSRDAQVEMIRVLRVARRGAMKGRIQAGAQIDALILTAPEPVRAPLRKLTSKQRIRACAALRPGQWPTRPQRSNRAAGAGPPLAGTAGRDR